MNESLISSIRSGSWENRLKNLDELIQANAEKILNKNEQDRDKYLSFIFDNTIDLLEQSMPNECRQRTLRLYCKLLNGHAESIGILRYYLFNRILAINLINTNVNHDFDNNDDASDDIPNLIDFLMVLTDHGKILSHYETEIANFIVILIEKLFERQSSTITLTTTNDRINDRLKLRKYDTTVQQKLLEFMINLIKYNAAYVSSDSSKALIKMIRFVCTLAYQSQSISELELIYEFLNVVLSYSHLPTETLSQFIVIVCIGINRDELYSVCNKIMRNLIGTYLGFDGLTTLHHIIEDEINFSDKLLIRGAVYFLVQLLWGDLISGGSSNDQTISLSANVILPAFKIILNNDMASSPLIALEIANGMQMFIISTIDRQLSYSSLPINETNDNRSLFNDNCQSNSDDTISMNKCSQFVNNQYTWHLVLDICDILVSNYLTAPKTTNNQQQQKPTDNSNQLKTTILSILKLLEKILNTSYDSNNIHNDDNDDFIKITTNNDYISSLRLIFTDDCFMEKFFNIFEMASDYLSIETIHNLIDYHLNHLNRYRFDLDQKFKHLKHIIEFYFIFSTNNSIKLKCLEKLEIFFHQCNFLNVDIFWEKVASNYFSICNDNLNNNSKEYAMNFIIFFAKNSRSNKNLFEFIDIFEMTIENRLKIYRQHSIETLNTQNRTQNVHSPGSITHQLSAPSMSSSSEATINNVFDDVIRSIDGLITIFIANIDHIYCHTASIQAFRSLIKVLKLIQKIHHPHSSHHHHHSMADDTKSSSAFIRTISSIKRKIFHTILSLRTNRWAQLGVVDCGNNDNNDYMINTNENSLENVCFTPYILIRDMVVMNNQSISPPISPKKQINNDSDRTNSNSPNMNNTSPQSSTSSQSFHVTFIEALKLIIETIQCEKDWSVLHLIFVELPKTLKHKGLILAAATTAAATTTSSTNSSNHSTPTSSMTHLCAYNNCDSIPDYFVTALCKFIDWILNNSNELYIGETKLNKVDILAHIYNSLSALVGYKLQPPSQNLIVLYLLNGLIYFSSKISCLRQCIVSLTICTIEMQTTMIRHLSDIIMQLSKITTTKALAIPKLEFLSNIIVFPDIYYTFTNKQYLSIFMIAQSYVNPYKYGEYTVALALRVISMWFLKCPIPCRMDLVHFLMKGFQNNILKDNEPNLAQIMTQKLSNDQNQTLRQSNNHFLMVSSPPPPPSTPLTQNTFSFNNNSFISGNTLTNDENRQSASISTSFSLSSSSAFNMVNHHHHNHQLLGNDSVIFDPNDKEKSKIELVEVCMDMLASNAFTTSSPLPLKPSMIDKLLNKDKTQFWMIGHKIIQITTTGCTSRAMRNGLCNKCFTVCHMNRQQTILSSPSNSLNHLVESINEKFTAGINTSDNTDNNTSSKSNQALIANRRRHRSEINHSTRMKYSHHTNDDYFINQQQQNMMTPKGSSSSTESDLNNISKYCRCWCQTWAEILIRRATGTTRLILRVENNLGEFPNWTSSKHEDDSLAKIFENSFPEMIIDLQNKFAGSLNNIYNDDNTVEISSNTADSNDKIEAMSDSGKISSSNIGQQQQPKAKISQPVSRAASFAGSRTSQTTDSKSHDAQHRIQDKETVKHVRKLEKDFSFEENTPEGSKTNLTSLSADNNDNNNNKNDDGSQQNFQPTTAFRDRGHTISVMTPVQKSSSSSSALGGSGHHFHSQVHDSLSASNMSLSSRQTFSPAGLSPQFVFLQLYYNSMFKDKICYPNFANLDENSEKPIQLDRNEALKISLNTFDRITPYETHKIGILYVGPGQTENRADILANQIGSYRYAKFLKDVGQLISLEDIDPRVFYVGGLGVKDGPYAISWCDHLVQMIFHVATMMPTLPNDPKCNNKMAHIGNDLVCIVYNNSGQHFDLFSLKTGFGQVMLAVILITPLEYDCNIVEIKSRKEFAEFIGYTESQVLSDDALPVYVRQLAIHANLGAMVYNPKQEMRSYHISNWLSRLRNIKRVRKRALEHHNHSHNNDNNNERYSVRSMTTNIGNGVRMARQNHSSSMISDEFPSSSSSSSLLMMATMTTNSNYSTATTTTITNTSSAISPNLYSNAGTNSNNSNNNVSFDYDTLTQQRLAAFPDFTEFTKDY